MTFRVIHWLILIFLTLVGVYSLGLGGFLIYLGGSWYYALHGVGILYLCWLVFKRDQRCLPVFGVLLALTLVWSIYESDQQFLALLPRIAFWMVIALWFLSPPFVRSLEASSSPGTSTGNKWIGLPWLASAISLVIFASLGYTQNGEGSFREVSGTSLKSTRADWRHYGNDAGGSRFAALDDINLDNVGSLKEAWRFRTGVEDDFKMTPLQANGLVYLCGAYNILIAIDDATGEERWRHDPQVAIPTVPSHQSEVLPRRNLRTSHGRTPRSRVESPATCCCSDTIDQRATELFPSDPQTCGPNAEESNG